MTTTAVTITREVGNGRPQSVTLSRPKRVVLSEPTTKDVLNLLQQEGSNLSITANFRKGRPLPEQIRELFEAGVSKINIYSKE